MPYISENPACPRLPGRSVCAPSCTKNGFVWHARRGGAGQSGAGTSVARVARCTAMLADLGIAVVFFCMAWGLPFASLRQACCVGRCICAVADLCRFTAPLVSAWMPAGLALGFCYRVLCRPPSSSVAMTGLARGNVPAAIFKRHPVQRAGHCAHPLLVAALAHLGGGRGMDLGQAVAQHCPPALAAPAGRTTAAPAAASPGISVTNAIPICWTAG